MRRNPLLLALALALLPMLAQAQPDDHAVSAEPVERGHHDPAQDSWSLGLEGMLGWSASRHIVAVNVGGPNLLLRLTRDVKIGAGAFPSLFRLGNEFRTGLGVSPRVEYKRLVFITPFLRTDDRWFSTVGFAYRF